MALRRSRIAQSALPTLFELLREWPVKKDWAGSARTRHQRRAANCSEIRVNGIWRQLPGAGATPQTTARNARWSTTCRGQESQGQSPV